MDELELLVFKEFVKGKIQADKLELDIKGFYKIGRFQMKQLQIIGKKILSELDKKDKIIEDIKFINNNNKPHIAQQKIREYFTNKVEEDK